MIASNVNKFLLPSLFKKLSLSIQYIVLDVRALLQNEDRKQSVRSVTSAATITTDDGTIECVGTFDVATPDALSSSGLIFNVKNSGDGVIGVRSADIDGEVVVRLYSGDNVQIQSTGSKFIVI